MNVEPPPISHICPAQGNHARAPPRPVHRVPGPRFVPETFSSQEWKLAWIESHQTLEKHPKTLDLMNATGWDLDTCLGKLHRFWYWCVDYAEDGDLRSTMTAA
jgi:hypothetical protein